MSLDDAHFTVVSAAHRVVGKEWGDSLLPLPYHRLWYQTGGMAELKQSGGRQILHVGDCFLVPASAQVSGVCETTMTHFEVRFLATDRNGLDPIEIHQPQQSGRLDAVMASQLFYMMCQCREGGDYADQLRVQGALRLVLAPFFAGETEIPTAVQRFLPVLRHIAESLIRSDVKMSELAEIAGLEKAYFSGKFSKAMGLAPQRYLIRKRIQLAQRLLLESSILVKEVGLRIGVQNEMYFSRLFGRWVGCSPGTYRRVLSGQ